MSTSYGPLITTPRRRLVRLWATLAFLNLGIGIAIALQPERLTDLDSVMRWGRLWLVDGVNVYAYEDFLVDYPPNAVVLLSPLGLLPFAAAIPLWVVANLAFACLAPYFAARFFQPHAPFGTIVLPILMFMSWWGTHTLTQFSLLALTLSMAAMMLAQARPVAGGVCLGLALMKPQVALPVFLWALFTRRWRMAGVAMATVAAGFAAFCARAGVSPVGVVERYLAILRIDYTGDAIMTGVSDLRPLIHTVVADVSQVDLIAGGIALGLLAGICAAGFQEGRTRREMLYTAPALVACWSLLTFYHLSYGFVVLLPALMLLYFNDAAHTPLRRTLFWVLQLGMVFDLPGIARRTGVATLPMFGVFFANADRLLIAAIMVGLVTLAWRESAPTTS